MGLPQNNRKYRILPSALLKACCCLPFTGFAAQHYEADIDSAGWTVDASNIRCEIKHQIPRFGEAVFIHSAGGELAFQMRVDSPPVQNSEALLYTSPPYWKPAIVARELTRSPLLKGKTPIYFTRKVALRMVYELDQGMQPTILYRDWADQTEDVSVAVSTVRFRDAWPDFVKCQANLLPYGFDDVKSTSMMFDSGSARLKKSAKEILDRVAKYTKKDKTVRKIRLTGHTDSIGFRYLNFLLSDRRARNVRKYLIFQGVPASYIKIKAKGEGRPKVSNRSLSGRRFNRRVQVELIR